MDRALGLIKTDYEEVEKRILPRFPFSYLTFKLKGDEAICGSKTYEVKDISRSGMKLCLHSGGHPFSSGNKLEGTLHWKGNSLDISGVVRWINGQQLGVAFDAKDQFKKRVEDFLSIENIISGMRPLHNSDLGLDIPQNLKYWLRSDGPVEIFVWCHQDGEIAKFQVILLDEFVEWAFGKGVITGNVLSKRDLETPLSSEDEFEFKIDQAAESGKKDFACRIIEKLDETFLPINIINFLLMKLGH